MALGLRAPFLHCFVSPLTPGVNVSIMLMSWPVWEKPSGPNCLANHTGPFQWHLVNGSIPFRGSHTSRQLHQSPCHCPSHPVHPLMALLTSALPMP